MSVDQTPGIDLEQYIVRHDIDYQKIMYPDGQLSVKVKGKYWNNAKLAHRINSYEDLFLMRSIVEATRYIHPGLEIEIYIPCLFGQRSDMRFSENQSFDLKIIADFINACGFTKVKIMDIHSTVGLGMINNSCNVIPKDFVQQAIGEARSISPEPDMVLISPDGGSYKKTFKYGEFVNLPVLAANKHRDKEGKISLKFVEDVSGKNCMIVDDLCDGGRTFVELAKQLKEHGANKVFLYISHAYFSAGLEELRRYIDHIWCTNSVKDLPDAWFNGNGTVPVSDYITQFKII